MKVLYLLNTTEMHGSSISFINMIKDMELKGIEIYIAHPDKNPNQIFMDHITGLVRGVYYVPMCAQTFRRPVRNKSVVRTLAKKTYLWYRLKLKNEIEQLTKIVIEVAPDIIHTNVGVIHSGFFVAKSLKIPHIWHLREYQTKDFNWEILPTKRVFTSLLRRSYVITITKDIRSFFGLDSCQKATFIYNGCFSEKDISLSFPKKRYFLCCSRVSEEKGHTEVIQAFSEFLKHNGEYRLVIAGFGNSKYIEELKALAASLNCLDHIEFVGYKCNIQPLMDYATALVVASRFEGFGRMTAEAAFRGCLVIGRNTGGTKEILEQTGGFLYDGGPEELAKQMNAVASLTEQQYRERAIHAQIIAKKEFSTEISNERIYSFYQSILQSKGKKID